MKKIISVALMVLTTAVSWSLTGEEIIEKMKDQNKQPSIQARIAATIEEKGSAPSERLIDQFTTTQNDLTKAVAVFQRPASVKDTRFLIVENENRGEDRWIFLPALKKVRRIAASEGGTSFIGEITYDDMSLGGTGDRTSTLLREETLGTEACYVVESIPQNPADSQYSRTVTWVSKEKWLPVKVEMFDKQNKLLKVADAVEMKLVQGVWSVMKLRMSNVQNGNVTTLAFQILEYGKAIPNGVFTTRFLETGRP